MMNVEVQQVINVLNAWLKPHGLRVSGWDDNSGQVADMRDSALTQYTEFPTVPHAVEWALNEARKRDGQKASAKSWSAMFPDIDFGDPDEGDEDGG
jgi:hypothetical protein